MPGRVALKRRLWIWPYGSATGEQSVCDRRNRFVAVSRVGGSQTIIENQSNLGYAAAVNQGLAVSSAELVLLLNPDIGALRGDIEAVLNPFENMRDLGALTPRLVGRSPAAVDMDVARRLWDASEALTGVRFPLGAPAGAAA